MTGNKNQEIMSVVNDTGANQKHSLGGAMAGSGSGWKEATYGLLGGIVFGFVSPAIGMPFDSVKTRMQADPAFHNTTFLQTVRQIYHTEGLLAFYRGFIPPLVGSMAFRGLSFSAYSGVYAASEKVSFLKEPIPFTGGLRPSVLTGALAASLARATIESPLDFIKVRYMVRKEVYDGTSSSRNVFLHQSPVKTMRQLYVGYVPTFFRTFGLLGSFFVMVDYSLRYIPDVVNAPTIGPFFKGGCCATLAWGFAFPFETAKSVIQADTTGKYKHTSGATWKVLKELYRERGVVKGLYRGFGPGAGRSFIANGASMLIYHEVQLLMRREF